MHYVQAKGILSPTNGMNLYRGCLHGCIYCDARSDCYQMHHLFTDIEVKENAIELLDDALSRKRRPCMVGTGAMSDPYIPLERELQFTRRALQVILRHGCGVALQTKSADVLRDLDLLTAIRDRAKVVVQITLTTADESLCRIVEPNVSTTRERYAALLKLRDAGIPTVVWLDPILPFLNDTKENVSAILDMCSEAKVKGIICFGMGVTLRSGNREYFYQQLDRRFPGLKERYIRTYGNAYELNSPRNSALMQFFHETCESRGILHNNDAIFRWMSAFETPEKQLSLWD